MNNDHPLAATFARFNEMVNLTHMNSSELEVLMNELEALQGRLEDRLTAVVEMEDE